jgi:hypothetical protein
MDPLNIRLRRREEDRLAGAEALVGDTNRVRGMVDFAHRTDRKLAQAVARRRVAESNAALREAVEQRRAKLDDLLRREREQYEREIEATFETPEQTKERCVDDELK